MNKQVNGLIWNSMVLTAKTKTGFELTDTNNDGKISRAEDSMANMIVHDFSTLDTFTPALGTSTPANTPTEEAN
jgi:hypothetical protein